MCAIHRIKNEVNKNSLNKCKMTFFYMFMGFYEMYQTAHIVTDKNLLIFSIFSDKIRIYFYCFVSTILHRTNKSMVIRCSAN